jgi:large conductance mechanosensitive channel
MLQEFKDFLTRTNAIALAIGVIIGAATGKVVTGVVDDVLMPVIALILPSGDWRQAKIVLKTVTDATGKVSESAITYGHLIGAIPGCQGFDQATTPGATHQELPGMPGIDIR